MPARRTNTFISFLSKSGEHVIPSRPRGTYQSYVLVLNAGGEGPQSFLVEGSSKWLPLRILMERKGS
jgi:hypothetical protein